MGQLALSHHESISQRAQLDSDEGRAAGLGRPRCGLVGHAHILAHQQHVAVLEHVDKPVEWGRVGPGASCHTCGALHREDYQSLLAPLVEEAAELSPREESSIQQFLFLLLHGCAR